MAHSDEHSEAHIKQRNELVSYGKADEVDWEIEPRLALTPDEEIQSMCAPSPSRFACSRLSKR